MPQGANTRSAGHGAREDAFAPECTAVRQRLCAHIARCLDDEDLNAASLAHAFGLSRAALYRLFGCYGGVACYIRELRLQTARERMETAPSLSLTQLLYELGFASERQFQRAFRARFGMPPSQWRRLHRGAAIHPLARAPHRLAPAPHDEAAPAPV